MNKSIIRMPILLDNDPDEEILKMSGIIPNKTFYNPEEYLNCLKSEGCEAISLEEKEARTIHTPNGTKTIMKTVATTTIQFRIRQAIDDLEKYAQLSEPLTPFDKDVLEACMTRQQKGKGYVTLSRIYHMFGGNRKVPERKAKQDIINSIDKMRHIDVRIDATEAYERLYRLKDSNGQPKRLPKGGQVLLENYLLPCKYITACVRGHIDDRVIIFLDASPVFQYAIDKGEVVAVPKTMLAIPNIKNTNTFLTLKGYLATRIQTIKRSQNGGGKKLHKLILMESIFANCGFPYSIKKDRKLRKRVRETTEVYLKGLIDTGDLTGFQYLDENDKEADSIQKCSKVKVSF